MSDDHTPNIKKRFRAPAYGGAVHLGLVEHDKEERMAEGMRKEAWDKMKDASRKDEEARAAVAGLVVRCGHPGCEEWEGESVEESRAHLLAVHGIDTQAMKGKYAITCVQCGKVFRSNGANARFCDIKCRSRYHGNKAKAERAAAVA